MAPFRGLIRKATCYAGGFFTLTHRELLQEMSRQITRVLICAHKLGVAASAQSGNRSGGGCNSTAAHPERQPLIRA